jgi:hypothetical protein
MAEGKSHHQHDGPINATSISPPVEGHKHSTQVLCAAMLQLAVRLTILVNPRFFGSTTGDIVTSSPSLQSSANAAKVGYHRYETLRVLQC